MELTCAFRHNRIPLHPCDGPVAFVAIAEARRELAALCKAHADYVAALIGREGIGWRRVWALSPVAPPAPTS